MKKQNKFWFAIIVMLVLTVCSIAFSEDVQVPVLIDGVRVAFFDQDGNLLQQKKVDDIVYVPLLSLCESMGMEAQVQGQSVSVNGMRIGMFDASGNFLSPLQFDGTDYVPLLAFCEATGVSATEENGKLIIFRAKQEATTPVPQDTKGKVALHPYNFGDYFAYDIRVDEGSFQTVQTRTQVSDGYIYSNDSEVDFVLTCDARSVFEIEDISFDVFGTMYEASAQLSGINSVGFYEDMPASGTLTRTKHETGITIISFKADVPKLQSVTLGDVSGYVILPAEKAEAANKESYQSGIRYLESDNYKAAKAIFAALKQLDYPNSQEKYAEALEVEKEVIAAEKKALEAERESQYQEALRLENQGNYEQALTLFDQLGTYKDCVDRVLKCKEMIDENIYVKARELQELQDYSAALELYQGIADYKDSKERILLCNDAAIECSAADAVYNGLVRVQRNGKYGFVDTNGRPVIPCIYEDAGNFTGEMAPVQLEADGMWGYINRIGELVVPYQYTFAGELKETFARVSINDRQGLINDLGECVLPCEYDFAGDITCGVAFFRGTGTKGIIDSDGNITYLTDYDMNRLTFSEGLAPVSQNRKNGFINTSGELVIPCQYDIAANFVRGNARVQKGNKWGLIDSTGTLLIPCKYDWVNPFSEGLSSVRINEKYGFIDAAGKQIIPMQYELAGDFCDGLAMVVKNKKYGFINANNEAVIPFEYDEALQFYEGVCIVRKNGCWGGIDQENNNVIPFEHKEKPNYVDGLYLVKTSGGNGFMTIAGDIIVPYIYDEAYYNDGWFTLLKDGVVTVVSREEIQPNYKELLEEREKKRAAELERQRMMREYTDKETVKIVQASLNEAGFLCGSPEGNAGKKTKAALSDYQTAKKLTVTGTITHETLVSLGLAN